MATEDNMEARKHKRYHTEIGSLRVLDSGSSEELGEIVNIGRGGLAYRYLPDMQQPLEPFKLDIFWVGNNKRILDGIACETVWDFDAAEKFPVGSGNYRVRGIKFGELVKNQKHQIEQTMKKHTLIEEHIH
jgi:hypothetical protein